MLPQVAADSVQAAPSGSGLAVPTPDQLPAGPLAQYPAYRQLMEDCWRREPGERPGMEEVAAAEMRMQQQTLVFK